MAKEALQTESAQSSDKGGTSVSLRPGMGVGLAEHSQDAVEGFMDVAAAQLMNDIGGEEEVEEPRRRKKTKERDDDRLDAEDDTGPAEEEEEEGEEETAGEEDEEAGGADDVEDEEEDDDARISVRLNGKKATLEDVLPHLSARVIVDGEEVEVDGEELLKGYQRGTDYTRKTTEVKQMREEILPYQQMVSFAKHDPEFMNYVQSYFQNGPYPEIAQNPDLRVTDSQLNQMFDQNSDQYDPERARNVLKLRAEWTQKSQERQRIMQAAQQDQSAAWGEWAKEQAQIAADQINAMGEPPGKDGKSELDRKGEQVVATLREMGFNDDQIAGRAMITTADAKLAVLAYKASEYDRIKKDSEAPRVTLGKKRKRNAPPRSQAPGSGTRSVGPSRRNQRDSYRKAVKSQKSDDWLDVIANRVKI